MPALPQTLPPTLKTVLITVAAAIVVLAVAVLIFIYSGWYNVAATAPHTAFGGWLLQTTRQRSIQAHTQQMEIDVPAVSGNELQHGIEHFVQMCVPCHGAPGVERGEYGKGMTPTPPDLAEVAAQWDDEQLFWVVKHGVKLAGMPAFGPTHTDEELWGIVAFVKQLPNVSAEEYRRVTADIPQGPGHGHTQTEQTEPTRPDDQPPTSGSPEEPAADHTHAPGQEHPPEPNTR